MPLPAPASEAARLTAAFRQAEAARAAQIAAATAVYYRTRVDPASESSIRAWLAVVIGRILAGHRRSASSGALYATALRRLELPGESPKTFLAQTVATEEQIATSLRVVGPNAYMKAFREIQEDKQLDPADVQVKLARLAKDTETKITGATLRHVQNGARQTTYAATADDKKTLGWVRVTRDRPCYFCALLASRGLQEGYVYTEDSFAASDVRFTGDGTAKVHDWCQCHLKPVYAEDDDYAQRADFFMELYQELWTGSMAEFRKNYNDWLAGKITVDA